MKKEKRKKKEKEQKKRKREDKKRNFWTVALFYFSLLFRTFCLFIPSPTIVEAGIKQEA